MPYTHSSKIMNNGFSQRPISFKYVRLWRKNNRRLYLYCSNIQNIDTRYAIICVLLMKNLRYPDVYLLIRGKFPIANVREDIVLHIYRHCTLLIARRKLALITYLMTIIYHHLLEHAVDKYGVKQIQFCVITHIFRYPNAETCINLF